MNPSEPDSFSCAIEGKREWERRVLSAVSKPERFAAIIDRLVAPFRNREVHLVAAFEALGFPFGAGAAQALNAGLLLIRKTRCDEISPEFETESIQDYSGELKAFKILKSAVPKASRVLIIDDYLETGGQLRSAVNLLHRLGAEILGASFIKRATSAKLDLSFFSPYTLHDLGTDACELVPIVT